MSEEDVKQRVRVGLRGGYIHFSEVKILYFPDCEDPVRVSFQSPCVSAELDYNSILYIKPDWKNQGSTDRRCGTCGFWDYKGAQDRAGRIRKKRPARCCWSMPWSLPSSVSGTDMYVHFMQADYGQDCPCWSERKKGKGNDRTKGVK